MFEQAAKDFPEISNDNSVIVGDSLSDIRAGAKLGIYTIFVEGEAKIRKPGRAEAVALAGTVVTSFAEAVDSILREQEIPPRES